MQPTSPLTGDLARAAISSQLDALEHQPDDAEGVHQRRVATRRLRAALSVFEAVLPAVADDLRAELAWLARTLGAVRDLDVQMAAIHDMAGDEDVGRVIHAFASRRLTAATALDLALASPRHAALIRGLRALQASAWPAESQASACSVAPGLIRKRHKRFKKAAKRVRRAAPAPKLHRARIRAKQLRYTLEFFVPLYGKPARRLVKRLVRVQDVLGAVQDAATLHDVLAEMQAEVTSPSIASLLLATDERMSAARGDIKAALSAVRRKKPWQRLGRALDQGSIENDTSVSGVATATVP